MLRLIEEHPALGSYWWLTIYQPLEAALEKELKQKILTLINQFDETYSRFKLTSLVSRLSSGETLTSFPPELYALLSYGEEIRILSEGYFTLAIGGRLENLGYDKEYSFKEKAYKNQLPPAPFSELTPEKITVAEGVHLDLGGIGKGWLIDLISAYLKLQGIAYFAVNGGGDIYATSDNEKPLTYALESPLVQGEAIGTITIKDEAIAASSGTKRRWKDPQTGTSHHHIINPFTGNSSSEKAGVFTLAHTATAADTASTLLFLVPDRLIAPIQAHLQVEYLIVSSEGETLASPGYRGELYR